VLNRADSIYIFYFKHTGFEACLRPTLNGGTEATEDDYGSENSLMEMTGLVRNGCVDCVKITSDYIDHEDGSNDEVQYIDKEQREQLEEHTWPWQPVTSSRTVTALLLVTRRRSVRELSAISKAAGVGDELHSFQLLDSIVGQGWEHERFASMGQQFYVCLFVCLPDVLVGFKRPMVVSADDWNYLKPKHEAVAPGYGKSSRIKARGIRA
jgi:hypothetical protein